MQLSTLRSYLGFLVWTHEWRPALPAGQTIHSLRAPQLYIHYCLNVCSAIITSSRGRVKSFKSFKYLSCIINVIILECVADDDKALSTLRLYSYQNNEFFLSFFISSHSETLLLWAWRCYWPYFCCRGYLWLRVLLIWTGPLWRGRSPSDTSPLTSTHPPRSATCPWWLIIFVIFHRMLMTSGMLWVGTSLAGFR